LPATCRIACHVGGKDGHTAYHPKKFACKNAAVNKACELFHLDHPYADLEIRSLKELRSRVLAR
jgi:hypothetical protein